MNYEFLKSGTSFSRNNKQNKNFSTSAYFRINGILKIFYAQRQQQKNETMFPQQGGKKAARKMEKDETERKEFIFTTIQE